MRLSMPPAAREWTSGAEAHSNFKILRGTESAALPRHWTRS